ncbi:MAG: glycosyltransferase family 2 protein [Zoogloeaceae bacterium]|jgi:glycosyltransferase involved in cell wall biosynthesis|nr:glycosyltransferase family 2 protein [Zoogloeaceae bacterium]
MDKSARKDSEKYYDGRKQPFVTVIISCYNHAPYIEKAVESVLAQDHSRMELLVIDDGSSDDSVARIRRPTDDSGNSWAQAS